jgi:hypothetical protein
MASSNAARLEARQIESYVDTANESSLEVTLSGTPGTVTTITLPNTAKGFKLYPRTNHIRFSVNNTSTAAVGTSSSTTVAASVFAVGGIAKNDMWETRLLPNGASRTLSLRSTTASVVVDVEVF